MKRVTILSFIHLLAILLRLVFDYKNALTSHAELTRTIHIKLIRRIVGYDDLNIRTSVARLSFKLDTFPILISSTMNTVLGSGKS